jgi:DNA-binding PadR family transcriptional regulator
MYIKKTKDKRHRHTYTHTNGGQRRVQSWGEKKGRRRQAGEGIEWPDHYAPNDGNDDTELRFQGSRKIFIITELRERWWMWCCSCCDRTFRLV